MRKYRVYLVTGETIPLEVEGFHTDYEHNTVLFIKNNGNVALFVFDNICGFCEVGEFKEEEND